MDKRDQELAHRLKLKFGTAPNHPTKTELENIKKEIAKLIQSGTTPTENDWLYTVKKYCPSTGKYFYGGADNSDLITLMRLATKK